MKALTYQMRYAVMTIARGHKQKAKRSIQSYLQIAYSTLQKDELEEFLRDMKVLHPDLKQVS